MQVYSIGELLYGYGYGTTGSATLESYYNNYKLEENSFVNG